MIEIVLNGEPRAVPDGQSILQLLTSLNIEPQRVAVELNRSIVRQNDWQSTLVLEGATVEIVQFVGGG